MSLIETNFHVRLKKKLAKGNLKHHLQNNNMSLT